MTSTLNTYRNSGFTFCWMKSPKLLNTGVILYYWVLIPLKLSYQMLKVPYSGNHEGKEHLVHKQLYIGLIHFCTKAADMNKV